MELEQSISNLEMYRANNSNYDEELANDIDVVLEALENSIPKEAIEEQLNYDKENYMSFIHADNKLEAIRNYIEYLKQEILEGK